MLTVYCDGAWSPRTHLGGWAWWVNDDLCYSGAEPATTNNRMELRAVIEALHVFPWGPLEVVSDSAYVVNCLNERWYSKWLVNGWLNSRKLPVENRDLWEELLGLLDGRDEPQWTHVKGHSGVEGNEAADRLAVAARLAAA